MLKNIYKLHEDGHFIYIITGRDNGLILTDAYDKHAKTEKCLEYNIDIMIDDYIRICSDCIKNGITTILMDTLYNRYSNIQRVKNWKEFYGYVSNKKRIKLF